MRIVPGPGKYDPPAGAFKKISYSIQGMTEKTVPGSLNSWTTPGPGNYENLNDLHYTKIAGSKIGKDNR